MYYVMGECWDLGFKCAVLKGLCMGEYWGLMEMCCV